MFKNKMLVSSLIVVGFLGSFSFASSSLETLTNLSNQAIAHSSNREKTISILKSVFTSCVQTNTSVDTKQLCQNLLNSSIFNPTISTSQITWKWNASSSKDKCFRLKIKSGTSALPTINRGDGNTTLFSGVEELVKGKPTGNLEMSACHMYGTNAVTTIQVSNPQTVTFLDLRNIGLISRDISAGSNIQQLYLGGNEINQLDNNSFNGLSSLELLYLGENQISSIASHTFDSLKNLKTLNLRKNNLSQFDSNRLKNLSNLEYFSLAENRIKSIDKKAFVGLKNLNYLDIGANPFGKLDIKYFQGLTNLSQNGDLPSFRS